MTALRDTLRRRLLAARRPDRTWRSELSASALGNAVALIALGRCRQAGEPDLDELVAPGLAWLVADQNDDGGFGDSPESVSNPSTSLLAWGAFALHPAPPETVQRVEAYLIATLGSLEPAPLAAALHRVYGADQTFSVPILAALALCGRLGHGAGAWRLVPSLPFELAAVPHRWWTWFNLRVVSYALPALIAVGQVRHHHLPARGPLGWVREAARRPTLGALTRTQPATGGFLEAVPLTAFVLMSLAAIGELQHPVSRASLRFLRTSRRADGSWPIDENLDGWVTALAIGALDPAALTDDDRRRLVRFLLDHQQHDIHPFTHAAPGGWAWTDLPGGVPDADDTPAALLALHRLRADAPRDEVVTAAERGAVWLLDLQNADGGIPTFCRGWGRLPFDASSPDLTAHTLRAWAAWRDDLTPATQARIDRGTRRALRFLLHQQRADGSWVPLWFGHQQHPRRENPVYGTSRVLRAAAAITPPDDLAPAWAAATERAMGWLFAVQGADGGWGPDAGITASIEETALALEALADLGVRDSHTDAGLRWLDTTTHGGERLPAAPIGLYFASLWYSEGLYPLVWSLSAVERLTRPT